MYPKANVPVIQLSIQGHLDPSRHLAVGRALSPLRDEGVLILGSGGAVHPLGYPGLKMSGPPDKWAIQFNDWLTRAIVEGDEKSLVRYRELAPYPERAHPFPDHYMPLAAAFGAGGPGVKGTILHASWYYGDFSMGAYSFDSPA